MLENGLPSIMAEEDVTQVEEIVERSVPPRVELIMDQTVSGGRRTQDVHPTSDRMLILLQWALSCIAKVGVVQTVQQRPVVRTYKRMLAPRRI